MKTFAANGRLAMLGAVLALALGACSATMSDDRMAATPQKDIVDTAVGAGSFNTLVAAVQAAGLVDTLKGPGPFTVFAPTDEAFAKLPAGTVDSLLRPENRDTLVAILTYHVVPGKVMSSDVIGKRVEAQTAQGQDIVVTGIGSVLVNGTSKVLAPDVEASNGVIHVVDRVILPPQG